MKRARASSSLTGGTGDVNPQLLKIQLDDIKPNASYDIANFTRQAPNPLAPLNQAFQAGQTTSIVMEILKVHYQFYPMGSNYSATGQEQIKEWNYVSLSGSDPGPSLNALPTAYADGAISNIAKIVGAGAPNVIDSALIADVFYSAGDVNTGTKYRASSTIPCEVIHDFTDETGHGLLFAGSYFYLNHTFLTNSAEHAAAATTFCQAVIEYRAKKVPLTEYLGMLSSYNVL